MKTQNVVRAHASDATLLYRDALYQRYMEKYRILWLGNYVVDPMPLSVANWIMERLWEVGNVCAFKLEVAPLQDTIVAFSSWIMFKYNLYREPASIYLLNKNNALGFPQGPLEVVYDPERQKSENAKAVIGYAQSNKEPIRDVVRDYVTLIVNTEMTIRTSLMASKQPFIATVSPEMKERAETFITRLQEDDPVLFSNGDDSIKVLSNGAPYIIDKLYQYKQQRENELLTYLGIDNVAIEKKERLTIDEANSNNDVINDHGESINRNLEEFFKTINAVFGTSYTIKNAHAMSESVHEEGKAQNDLSTDDDK